MLPEVSQLIQNTFCELETDLVTDFLSGSLGVTCASLTGWIVPSSPHTVVALTALNPVCTVALPRVQTAKKSGYLWPVYSSLGFMLIWYLQDMSPFVPSVRQLHS